MPPRIQSEKDFPLKTALRKILWAQGYTTRIDVLLAYDVDPKGRARAGRAGLTDLDVLGLRLDPGFHVHTVVGECKSGAEGVTENLFWLSGVASFFGANTAMLVRSGRVPEHNPILAKQLGIALVGDTDLEIMSNIYAPPSLSGNSGSWDDFFSADVIGEGFQILSQLPQSLRPVAIYRETQYWMQQPYLRLTRTVAIMRAFARENRDNLGRRTGLALFADFVWLYVLAIWTACERLAISGLSRLEQGLRMYLVGDEEGLKIAQRLTNFAEDLGRRMNGAHVSLPIYPPYFNELHDLIARCVRRPQALARMARRAEWLFYGQVIADRQEPPWDFEEDDAFADKILGDVALFLANASGTQLSFVDQYLSLLTSPRSSTADDTVRDSSGGNADTRHLAEASEEAWFTKPSKSESSPAEDPIAIQNSILEIAEDPIVQAKSDHETSTPTTDHQEDGSKGS